MDKRSQLKKKKALENNRHYKEPDRQLVNYDERNPIFSFYNIEYGKSYCLSRCGQDDKAKIVHTLLMVSQKKWQDITSTDRKQLGYEHIPIKQFHATSYPDIVTDDVTSLVVFMYSHGGRLAGVRENDIFHIVLVGDNLYNH